MNKKFKNITKPDIIASIIYLIFAVGYLILNKLYFKLSPNVNFLILLVFLCSSSLYRNLRKR